eukprot:1078766-Prymnesium_polylepis.1
MFVKYNDLLRGFGPALVGCKDNTYTTTMHVINSVIVKSSKLTKARKVYRGVGGGVLPSSFWQANEQGVKGGIEVGCTSFSPGLLISSCHARLTRCCCAD